VRPTLVIDADAGSSAGLGHLMRCMALAQAWSDRGGRAVFVLPCGSTVDLRRLATANIEWRQVPADQAGRASAAHVAATASEASAAGVVLDGYGFDRQYVETVRAGGVPLALIDDDGSGASLMPDYLINHNPFASPQLYAGLPGRTLLLAGPDYTLLRREFLALRRKRRVTKPDVCDVLVTLGGGASGGLLGSVVAALTGPAREPALRITVVSGPLGRSPESVPASLPVRQLHDVWDLSTHMAAADVVISAAGVTSWELAYLGVPTILIVRAKNQRLVAHHLVERGAALAAGEPGPAIVERLAECWALLETRDRRRRLSVRAKTITDGYGADRLAMSLARGKLRLRPVDRADRRLLWAWALEPEVREASFEPQPIPWATHVAWFKSRLGDERTALYVAVDANERPAGQVRIEERADGEAVVSCSLDADHRGHGLGAELLALAAARFWNTRGSKDLHAYVRPQNFASAKAFAAAGYSDAGATEVHGHLALHFVLSGVGEAAGGCLRGAEGVRHEPER